jgi:hypothetical protein
MLYRGVNESLDKKNGGLLIPKGCEVEICIRYDGAAQHDGNFTHGHSQSNTARAHQIQSGLYDGCGVSTTRSEEKAIFFATSGNMEDGYVYLIDENRLEKENIIAYEFQDPQYPDEVEVTLIDQSGNPLSSSIVIDKYFVRVDGSQK